MCHLCNGSGWVVALKKPNKEIFSFRSSCGAADRARISKQIPTWNESLKKYYDLDNEKHLASAPAIDLKMSSPQEPDF